MTGLSRKLARLEVMVQAQQPAAPTFWTPARIDEWSHWVVRFLETMPAGRATVAYVELTTLPADQWSPLTRHVETMATHAVMGAWYAYISQGRPVALPETVCVVLEAHPDADVRSAFDCEDCGFETPARSSAAWRQYREEIRAAGRQVDPADRAFLTTCPLCDGAVSWIGYDAKRWRALWERQKAEMAAASGRA